MPPTILHVEDDLALRAVVTLTFQHLGFRGATIYATTVAQGRRALEQAAHDGRRFDLILSDMHLPDGTGLDLVKYVRANPTWHSTPMLILSGDLAAKYVDRAYALGANAYVDKNPAGRTTSDVVTTLYRHWLHDVVPPRTNSEPTAEVIARMIAICQRIADIYVSIADQLGDTGSESAFWLSQALVESNLTNLLAFLNQQIDGLSLSTELIGELTGVEQAIESSLDTIENDLTAARLPRDEIYRRILGLLTVIDIKVVTKAVAALFPITPAAAHALRDFLVASISDASAWIDLHTATTELHAHADALRSAIAQLATQPGT